MNQSVGKLNEPFGNILETLPDVPRNEPGSNNITDEDLIRRLGKLKNPPDGLDAEMLEETSVDDEIEERLIRLKFFRKTWCKQPSNNEKTSEQEPMVQRSEHQLSEKFTTSSIPQNLDKSPPNCNCMKNTSNQTKVMKQQNTNTNMVPDKIPELKSMQGMVFLLVLTILKLLHHPKCRPRLSYVPAPFPSQSYSDIETTNSTTTKPSTDIISGKRSLLSMLKKIRCVERCGNVRDLVKKVVLGYKTGLLEKVNTLRMGSAQVLRVCVEKITGTMIVCVEKVTGKMNRCVEKVAKIIEPNN